MSFIKPQPLCFAIVQQLALAAAGVVQPNFNIGADADFYLTELRATYVKAAAFTTGGITLQIQLQSGDLFSNGAINMLSFASGNQLPGYGMPIMFDNIVNPDGRIGIKIPKNSTVQCNITNADAAAVASIQVQLWGYKVDGSN
jgi:hypothetical protein